MSTSKYSAGIADLVRHECVRAFKLFNFNMV
jgi:hypothetical protein